MSLSAIPVLYYHRVNSIDGRLAVRPEVFAAQMERLARAGWRGLHAAELLSCLETGRAPERALVITFDDGFADNWYRAYPILARVGLRAMIFLVTERVWEGEARPGDQAGLEGGPPWRRFNEANKAFLRGDPADYLNTGEVRAMTASGLIEFGSHTSTHAPAFASGRLQGFVLSPEPHWARLMLAGINPAPGEPLFEWASAVTVRRYFPDPAHRRALLAEAEKAGGFAAIARDGKEAWRQTLRARAAALGPAGGKFEGSAEAERRILADLAGSRAAVERVTGRTCAALCWPWGHYSDLALAAARRAGYGLAFTTETGAIRPGQNPLVLPRLRVSGRTSPALLAAMVSALARRPLAWIAAGVASSKRVRQTLPPDR